MRARKRFGIALISCSIALLTACGDSNPPSAKPKLPFGVVDTPRPGATVHGNFAVGGWALSEDGIREVDFYLDRNWVKTVKTGGSRPDVEKAYPGIAHNSDAGYDGVVVVAPYPPGTHELTVQAINNSGAFRELGSFSVNLTK